MATRDHSVELLHRAVIALQRGAWAEAEALARTVLQRVGPDANALMVVASVRAEAGDPAGAIALYEQARDLMPTHIHVLVNLAALYRATGRLQEARTTLVAAVSANPRFAIAHNNLGNVLSDMGERAQAQHAYQRAAALDPRYPDPLAALAGLAEEEHRVEDASALIERALKLAPQSGLVRLTWARVKMRQNDVGGAAEVLDGLLRSDALSRTNRVLAEGTLGDAYDRLGRYGDAFAAFTRANALQLEQCAPLIDADRGPLSPRAVARLTQFIARIEPSQWQLASSPARTPIFIVGFPRSGTTLLDQILASHPEITTLEERDSLIDVTRELMHQQADYERWARLPVEEIERLRALYWKRVDSALAGTSPRRLFVDKQPLNAVLLPVIHRLFPTAPIILALRDPRDVLLSCYQQRFAMNPAMYQLLRLDTAAAYYDAVMNLVELCRGKLPLRIYPVKYEDVVANLEATMRAVLEFLGLDWHRGLHEHAETARTRIISTPSAAQVVRPLYASSCGRWRNYREFLRPSFATLERWVQTLGYDAE